MNIESLDRLYVKPEAKELVGEQLEGMAEKSKEEKENHPLAKELYNLGENIKFLNELIKQQRLENNGIKKVKDSIINSLVNNTELLNEKLKEKGEIIPQCSFEHNIRSLLMTFNSTINDLREGKRAPSHFSEDRIAHLAEICEFLKYIIFYIKNMCNNKEVFQNETESKHGFVGKYDNIFRRPDFSEKERCQLSSSEYLLLFYLLKNSKEQVGVQGKEFDDILFQLAAKERVLDSRKIQERRIENRAGAVFLDLSGAEDIKENIIYN